MSLKRISLTAALFSTLMAGSAAAMEFYVEGFAGGPIPRGFRTNIEGGFGNATYTPRPGFAVGGGVGVYITPSIRADLTVLHAWAGGGSLTLDSGVGGVIPHSGTVSGTVILGNAYYEFLNESRFTPWLGAGLGATIFTYGGLGATGGAFTYNGSATSFTGAIHAGVDFALTDMVDITGRYSFTYTGPHRIESTPAGNAQNFRGGIDNTFLVGLRVKFGG